jgi:hypothetical protein
MQELPWGYWSKRKTSFKAVGENGNELVHGLSYKEKSNQRLFGMPRLNALQIADCTCLPAGRDCRLKI